VLGGTCFAGLTPVDFAMIIVESFAVNARGEQ
jgi:hypothetical protein